MLDFFAPPSGYGCGAALVFGGAVVKDEEMVMTNGAAGASVMMLLPEVVEDTFPDSRDYRVRVRVNFETHSGIFYVFVRTRIGAETYQREYSSRNQQRKGGGGVHFDSDRNKLHRAGAGGPYRKGYPSSRCERGLASTVQPSRSGAYR